MIVLHSLKVLEQLTEIEGKIAVIEKQMREKGINLDYEELLRCLIQHQQQKTKRAS